MKKINSVKELQKIINDMRMNLKYKSVHCRIDGQDLGSVRKAEDLINHVFFKKLKSENETIVEFYDKRREYETKICKINTKNTKPIVKSLIDMFEQYDIYIDEDDIPSEMLNNYIDSVKEILQKYQMTQEVMIRKEIPIDTFDISDIVNISL